jgi:predicted  nucleic acid-binding Zn-ribbon protein
MSEEALREPKPGFEKVWAMFQETRRIMQESSRELDRRFQETDRRMQETDNKISRLSSRIGDMEAKGHAVKQGFFVFEQSGDMVRISVPTGFVPREW